MFSGVIVRSRRHNVVHTVSHLRFYFDLSVNDLISGAGDNDTFAMG